MDSGNGTTALAVAPRGEIISTQELRAGLQAAKEQAQVLGEFVRDVMTEGIDYGTIPGTAKRDKAGNEIPNRTLLKPGAEKLMSLFRCYPRFKITERKEDPTRGLYAYEFRCSVISPANGEKRIVAEGFGSASSLESKYRWRQADRKCPTCGKPTIIKGKEEYGGGWICFAKKGGCGGKFKAGDKAIEGQQVGRIENPDAADIANTVLKMAKKRALVDATLALARCSDLFGQDLEDLADNGALPQAREEPKAAKAPAPGAVVDPFTGEVMDPTKPTPEELAARIEEDMRAAGTLDELNGLAAKVKDLPEAHRTWLRDVYRNRKGALEAEAFGPGAQG